MKQNCYIVSDLMANYIEGLVSEQTAQDMSEHLAECERCRSLYECMSAPIGKEMLESDVSEREDNVRKVSYLKKTKKVNRNLIIALCVAAALYAALLMPFVAMFCWGIGSETITDTAQYESVLGEYGKYKDNYIAYNDIFPDEIPQKASVEAFHCEHYAGALDDCYMSYLVYTCPDEVFENEYERLKGLESTDDYNVYGTTGFRYELCAVYANEGGMIYALADEPNNRFIYVGLEFFNFICDIDYEKVIDEQYLPIGFDAGEGNATRQAFDEQYGFVV